MLICFVGYLAQRGYGLGIVEAIATTIFIGFACDYCCHVAQVRSFASLSLSRSRSLGLGLGLGLGRSLGLRIEPILSSPQANPHILATLLARLRLNPSLQVHASVTARGGGGDGGGGGPRGAEHLALTLVHAGPSLYGAALTTVGAALPLLLCYVVVFRQMGEFISVCTCFSFAVALTLIAPAVCVAADVAAACRRPPGSAGGRGSAIASPKLAASGLAGTLAARLGRRSLCRKVDVAKLAAGGDSLPGTHRTSWSSSSWSSSWSSSSTT